MNSADKARELAVYFEAKKDSLAQRQSGEWKLAFTVQPGDVPTDLLKAAMGTRYMVALVEIGDDETPVERPVEKPKDNPHKLSQQAAMLCGEGRFQAFLSAQCPNGFPYDDIESARRVRVLCRVDSRAELDANPEAAARWRNLKAEYEAWLIT
jgi:hypothetical protein